VVQEQIRNGDGIDSTMEVVTGVARLNA
jgi:hypothetical protein